ncbi:MAG TPA: carboxypeptidase M32 [Chloroflexi bacterium]|nr:carboxypeptidase M32 [Chloroflexota bacterium]
MGEKIKQLQGHLYPSFDLGHASGVLSWDQEVYMPPGGAQARAEQLATLAAMGHEILVSDETGALLEAAEAEVEAEGLDYDSDDASLVRVTRRQYDRMTKIPTEIVAEMSRATSQAFVAWRQAREENDFSLFQPHLQKIVDLNVKIADILGYEEHPYDALLDFFEPGIKTAQITQLFEELKAGQVPLLQEIVERGKPVDDDFFSREYPVERQWDLTLVMLRDIGYDFSHGRQDKAPHPFTIHFSCNDVRVTTRLFSDRPQSAIFSSTHEGGHALYEQGIPEKFERTFLAGGATLGLHESQSRMWENLVGRSRPFWRHYLPIMRAFFPEQLADVSFEEFYRGINKVQPDLIRVEADEVTYNMHIFVRFELEQALIKGELPIADVPDAWNAKYEEYLGITPPNDAEGCLQDIHWSHGTIGYFPTYTLGNLISAQLYARAKQELPGLEEGFTRGEFAPLLQWLRDHVHAHGSKFTAPELLERELGEEIRAQPYLEYMRAKYTDIYDL